MVTRREWTGKWLGLRANPERKTGCSTQRLWSWLVPASYNWPGGCHAALWIWLSKQASGKERPSMKPEQRCGKPSSGTRPRQGGARWQHLSFPRAGTWNMALPWRWRSRAILPGLQALANDLGKALPGGYVGPIQLPAHASRTFRAEPWRACKGYRTAASRRSL